MAPIHSRQARLGPAKASAAVPWGSNCSCRYEGQGNSDTELKSAINRWPFTFIYSQLSDETGVINASHFCLGRQILLAVSKCWIY